GLPHITFAQTDPVFDAMGFQQNRAYESQFEFEHIDPFIGNVILAFTDLTLPGNAGMDLRWERVHNSKVQGGGWTFGVPGLPMFILHADVRLQSNERPMPIFVTSDGATHATAYLGDQN